MIDSRAIMNRTTIFMLSLLLAFSAHVPAVSPDAVGCNHYERYAAPVARAGLGPLPGGTDAPTFFHLVNVDTQSSCYF